MVPNQSETIFCVMGLYFPQILLLKFDKFKKEEKINILCYKQSEQNPEPDFYMNGSNTIKFELKKNLLI